MTFEISEAPYRATFLCAQNFRLSIFPSYGFRCDTVPVCSFLMDRS